MIYYKSSNKPSTAEDLLLSIEINFIGGEHKVITLKQQYAVEAILIKRVRKTAKNWSGGRVPPASLVPEAASETSKIDYVYKHLLEFDKV